MNKTELFDAIWEVVKNTDPPVDFKEVVVGDEKTNQVYYLFDNVKNAENVNEKGGFSMNTKDEFEIKFRQLETVLGLIISRDLSFRHPRESAISHRSPCGIYNRGYIK